MSIDNEIITDMVQLLNEINTDIRHCEFYGMFNMSIISKDLVHCSPSVP